MIRNIYALPLLSLLVFLTASCNRIDMAEDENLISAENVRTVYNFLPPTGYSTTGYNETFPNAATGFYNNVVTDQNVTVSAIANLTGSAITVDQITIASAFVSATDIQTTMINGTDVHQAMDGTTYRAVIFRGQWQFDIAVLDNPDPSVGATEAAKFVNLVAEAMTTF